MKQLFYFLAILMTANTFAQTLLTVKSEPEKAIIFLNGAQLYHSKSVQLEAGLTDVIFEGIPNSVDANSLQAGGKGDFTILDIQYRMQYPEPIAQSALPDAIQKKIKSLQDSIKNKNYELTDISYKVEVLNYQKSMMLNSKLLSGGGKTDSIQLLKDAIAFYGEKLNDIYTETLRLNKLQNKIYEELNGMNTRLNDLNNYWAQQNKSINPNIPVPQIIVSVNAELATSAKVEMNYVTYNAGWYATYDIRATDIGKPVQLNYKANIWQNTGIDWKNIKLTCSTGNPMLGNNLPELTTWYVGYYQQYYERDYNEKNQSAPSAVDEDINTTMGSIASGKLADTVKDANYSYNYTTPMQTIANVEFEINLNYNIPSDGKGHLVSLQSETLKSDYNYLIVPKIDQSAFLIARITEWEDKNLLPGNANIYFNNTYVGKTYIDPLALSDTLSLSLGRDKTIDVKRTQVNDKTTDRILGLNNTKSIAYEIEVRNGKAIPIEVIIKDQIPISQDDDIKVEVLETGKGELNETTGIVTWRKHLKPKEAEKYELQFEITYPKNTTLGSL
ncbi:MAG: DUF4139 domain-containing protein [Fimbriimonadaceae bacterium]|nr:DUF4139 domain-containing protein [Chitinophagales bacterium]